MTEQTIKMATLADVPRLEGLFRRSYGELLGSHYPDTFLHRALPLLSKPNRVLIEAGQFFLIEGGDGSLAGAGGWSYEAPGSGERLANHAHIRHVAVAPDATGRGIGRSLIEHCYARASDVLVWECFSTLSAVGFYRALGFDILREITVSLGGELDFTSVHMTRRLSEK